MLMCVAFLVATSTQQDGEMQQELQLFEKMGIQLAKNVVVCISE